jgi:hypothetical protein
MIMSDRILTSHQVNYELEYIENEDALTKYLKEIVPYIGWIIVYFNSLEEHISDFIREAILRDPFHDTRLDVLLSEMSFLGKCKGLIHLYGQLIEDSSIEYKQKDLNELEKMLNECMMRRNEYAHANWLGVTKENYVRVKSKSKKQGVFHLFKNLDIVKAKEDIEFINNSRFILNEFNDQIMEQFYTRNPS